MESPFSSDTTDALAAAASTLQQLSGALHLLHYTRSAPSLADEEVEANLWQCVQELTQELNGHRALLQTKVSASASK